MLIKTILNKCHKFKSFVYQDVILTKYQGNDALEVTVVPRKNATALCSCCGKKASSYDLLSERRFEFIPLWGYRVFLLYTMRRVCCQLCGVKVEQIPWAKGKKELTTTYMQYLAFWTQNLSWQQVARTFHTSWEKVVEISCSRPLLTSCKQKCSISFSKSSFHNEEDGRLLACPQGASVESQSFVVALENDQPLSTSDALT